jgi:hypothetical protein
MRDPTGTARLRSAYRTEAQRPIISQARKARPCTSRSPDERFHTARLSASSHLCLDASRRSGAARTVPETRNLWPFPHSQPSASPILSSGFALLLQIGQVSSSADEGEGLETRDALARRRQVKRGLEIRRARQFNVVVPIVPLGYAVRVRHRRAAPARTSPPTEGLGRSLQFDVMQIRWPALIARADICDAKSPIGLW